MAGVTGADFQKTKEDEKPKLDFGEMKIAAGHQPITEQKKDNAYIKKQRAQ